MTRHSVISFVAYIDTSHKIVIFCFLLVSNSKDMTRKNHIFFELNGTFFALYSVSDVQKELAETDDPERLTGAEPKPI